MTSNRQEESLLLIEKKTENSLNEQKQDPNKLWNLY